MQKSISSETEINRLIRMGKKLSFAQFLMGSVTKAPFTSGMAPRTSINNIVFSLLSAVVLFVGTFDVCMKNIYILNDYRVNRMSEIIRTKLCRWYSPRLGTTQIQQIYQSYIFPDGPIGLPKVVSLTFFENRELNLRRGSELEPEPGPNLVEPVHIGLVLVRTAFEQDKNTIYFK